MSHTECSILSKYNSLLDKNLSGYFANTKMRKHLVKCGLISKDGRITSESAYRLKMAKKEHRENVRDLLASAIVDKALDMERMRQYEVRKRLEELYKIELVQKVRSGRGKRVNDDLVALLTPRQKKSSKQRKSRSAATTDKEKKDVKLPNIHFNERTKKMYYQHGVSTSSNSNGSTTTNNSGNISSSNNGPMLRVKQSASHRDQKILYPHPPPSSGKKKKKKNIHRGLMLAKSDNLVAHRVQLQSMAEVTMKYLGSPLNLTNDIFPSNKLCEIQIIQQHCGASTICVFRELLPANTVFTFVSRRHRGSPFGLTVYIDGLQNIRVSSCCEYKHKPGYKIGGKKSQFALIAVQGAAPCYRCQIRLNLIDNDKEKEYEEKLSSSDEESAMKSYDIIVSRAGRHNDSRLDRPVSASVMTQTMEKEVPRETEEEKVERRYEYQEEEFEDEQQFNVNQPDLSSDLDDVLSSQSSDSDSEDSKRDDEEEDSYSVSSRSSDSDVERSMYRGDVSNEEDLHEGTGKEHRKASNSSGAEDSSDARNSAEKVDMSDDYENISGTVHVKINELNVDHDKDASDDESTLSGSSKSSEHSSSSDEHHHDSLNEADNTSSVAKHDISDAEFQGKESENIRESDSSDTEVANASSESDDDNEGKIGDSDDEEATEKRGSDNEEVNEKVESDIAEMGVENIVLSDRDDDTDSDEYAIGKAASIISRESTMLTGNEDGEFDKANKTIQFNEEVDVVHYAKVEGTSTEEETPRSNDDDAEFTVESIGEIISLVQVDDDDDEDENESGNGDIESNVKDSENEDDVGELNSEKVEEFPLPSSQLSLSEGIDNFHRQFPFEEHFKEFTDHHSEKKEEDNERIHRENEFSDQLPENEEEEDERVPKEDKITDQQSENEYEEEEVIFSTVDSLVEDWENVQIVNANLSDQQTEEFLHSIEENKDRIISLSLENTVLVGGMERLKYVLKDITSLRCLNLKNMKISAEELGHIVEVLRHGSHQIDTLRLNGNPLGDVGIELLVSVLRHLKAIKVLNLCDCQINDDGAETLFDYLCENVSISDLSLSSNLFTLEGWRYIASSLKINVSLTTLSVAGNKMGNDGFRILSRGIIESKRLADVDLQGNALDDDIADVLFEAVERCPGLVNVTIMPDNLFSSESRDKLELLLDKKKARLGNDNDFA